jgi:hypothetical protein
MFLKFKNYVFFLGFFIHQSPVRVPTVFHCYRDWNLKVNKCLPKADVSLSAGQ